MKYLLSLLALTAPAFPQTAEDPGPHPVGWEDVVFPDPSGGTLEARLFYPAVANGQSTAADPGAGPFPLVAFLHRYLGDAADYDLLSTHIASWGFFVASIDTQTGGPATMKKEARDSADMLNWVAAESTDPVSPYFEMVAPGPWGAVGHSMGGGALFYLIEDDPNVQVLVAMEPYRGNGLGGFMDSIEPLKDFPGKLFIVGGSEDLVAPVSTDSFEYFKGAKSAARRFHTTVEGLGHQGPIDSPPNNEPLPAADQHRLHRRICGAFLRAEFHGEEQLYLELLGEGAAAEPLTSDSRSDQPAFWVAPSAVVADTLVTGLASWASDAIAMAVSLSTASIPTSYGVFGLDLGSGLVFLESVLPASGIAEFSAAIPPALSGTTLHFQGFATDLDRAVLTVVHSVDLP